jgi:hypothetical protein
MYLVRDSSDCFFSDLLEPWDVKSALHRENSGFAAATLRRHTSDFIFYPKPLYKSLHQSFFYSFIKKTPHPQKVVLHSITVRFSLRPYDFVISHPFWNICHVISRKLRLPQCIMGDDLHIKQIFLLRIIGTC